MATSRTTPRGRAVLLYLYGMPNLVGSALGLVGLALFFAGVINQFWFVIVIGLYFIGVLATPRSERFDLTIRNQLTAEDIRDELDRLVATARRRLPADLVPKVESIRDTIIGLLPFITDVNSADHNVYTIRQTALDYLPAALEYYVNLPKAFANVHPVKDGKTARQVLSQQLDLLDSSMREITEDFARNDAQRLLAHGRFLEERFQQPELLFHASSRR